MILIRPQPIGESVLASSNTTHAQESKIGPSAWMKIGSTWHGWVEGIQNTGFPTSPSLDGMTAFMKVTAPSLQGPYTVSPATTRVLDAGDETTWEHYEFSPADVVSYGGNLVFMCHGGNNSGPQHMAGGAFH